MKFKSRWSSLFITQFFGVFNDNFLKNCIIFISVFWLAKEEQNMVIPVASALLVVPFVLFSPLAGKLAQQYPKQKIFEWAKLAEIPIMVIAVVGFYMQSMTVVMVSLLFMGLQSALYAPSKFGLIRDVGGMDGLSFGVGTMELLTFLGVLVGQLVAGIVSDSPTIINVAVSMVLLSFAVGGWLSCRTIKAIEDPPEEVIKDSVNPVLFLVQAVRWSRTVKGLNTTILGLGGFWLVAALIQMNIYHHGPAVYQFTNTQTAMVMGLVAVGIGLGCWIAGVLSSHKVELGMVPIGGLGLSVIMTIFALVPLGPGAFIILLFFAAFFSGFYKVPLSAWIQERVKGRKLGQTLAFNQMMGFLFILLASGIFGYVIKNFSSFIVFGVIAVVSWAMTLITIYNVPAMMLRFIAWLMVRFYFRLDVRGIENIPPKSGALLVANHISMADSFLIVASVYRQLRFVMKREVYEYPLWHWLMKKLNMVPISSRLDKEKLEEFNNLCRKEVNDGHVVCIFPEGQISRIGHLLQFKKGIEHIARDTNVPIIPVHMDGVKDTPFAFPLFSSKPIKPGWQAFRKRITVRIGKPTYDSSAFTLRHEVQLLNTLTFRDRILPHHTLGYFALKTMKEFDKMDFVLSGDKSAWSFIKLRRRALSLAKKLHFIPSREVAMRCVETENYILINIALTLAGKSIVHLPPEMSDEEVATVLQRQGTPPLVHDEGQRLEKYGNIQYAIGEILEKKAAGFKGHTVLKTSVCGVFFSKNEEGQWQRNEYTHENFLAILKAMMNIFEKPVGQRIYAQMPLYSSFGNLYKLWLPLYFGMTICLPEGDQIAAISHTIQNKKINYLLIYRDLLENLYHQMPPEAWATVKEVITGRERLGEKIKLALRQQHQVEVRESLGLIETGLTLAINTPDFEGTDVAGKKLVQEGSVNGSYGRPLPGVAIKFVNPERPGVMCDPGERGQLMICGASVDSETLREKYTFEGDWLVTSEMGYMDEHGFVYVE